MIQLSQLERQSLPEGDGATVICGVKRLITDKAL